MPNATSRVRANTGGAPGRRFAGGVGRWGIALLSVAVLQLCGGCIFILNWSEEGLPCDANKKCNPGYSCLVNRCVAEGSLLAGETCSASKQCESYPENICGSNPFTCRKRCPSGYLAATAGVCSAGEYCRHEVDRDQSNTYTGTCVSSECGTSADCNKPGATAGRSCVAVTPTANACMLTCEITQPPVAPPATADYEDTCGSVTGQIYCHPVGPKDNPSLVCLSRLETDQTGLPDVGSECQVIANSCKSGAACVGSGRQLCRQFCDTRDNDAQQLNANCPSNAQYCCPQPQSGTTVYAVCLPDGCTGL
ncbi:MAG: hypothetical protein HY903_01255 [Deltaproteobacteria bacterium]|nr:hypothetical protein [Deltaproteobacteria bacterium]